MAKLSVTDPAIVMLRLQCRCGHRTAEPFLVAKFRVEGAPDERKDRSSAGTYPGDRPEPDATTGDLVARRHRRVSGPGSGRLIPQSRAGERGRLLFALDATMSRQPTWDQACQLQAEMFREAAAVGGLDLQLVYYRGLAECRASGWVAGPERFGELMSRIDCRGGHDADRQSSEACAARERSIQSGRARFHRRRYGGKSRRTLFRRR